ncbi:hypothetical protein NDU88_005886 [Pleurodeles waltl]|uniref:Uncharacterized protein n=1 Tax=Pleurodeles waltl TaxID=8319 RepID=A0AAV7MXK9_PLEWA|nr:hypothetical protein NDU88_005886 [Pleurodeles waltl]
MTSTLLVEAWRCLERCFDDLPMATTRVLHQDWESVATGYQAGSWECRPGQSPPIGPCSASASCTYGSEVPGEQAKEKEFFYILLRWRGTGEFKKRFSSLKLAKLDFSLLRTELRLEKVESNLVEQAHEQDEQAIQLKSVNGSSIPMLEKVDDIEIRARCNNIQMRSTDKNIHCQELES